MTDATPERWLPIAGYPNYEVSDWGRVWSRPRNGTKGGMLKPVWQGGKYLVVSLWRDRKYTTYRVHTLVLEAFDKPRPEGLVGRHLDGNPENCRFDNLCWGTQEENAQDRVRHGRDAHANKTHCPQGHEYTEENTGWHNGHRRCRKCDQIRHEQGRSSTEFEQTHCIHGHEYTPENSYIDSRGWRQCRTCRGDRARKRYVSSK